MLENNRKIRLLHICSYTWEIGGPPSVIYNLSHQFNNVVDTDIVSPIEKNHKLYSIFEGQKVFVFNKSFLSKLIPDFSLNLFFWFKKYSEQYDYIVVHGLWNFGSVLAYFLNNRSRLILTVHGFLDPFVLNKSKLFKFIYWNIFQKYCFNKADIIHAISIDEERLLQERFPNFKYKIKFIPNGIQDPLIKKNTTSIDIIFKLLLDEFLSDSEYTFLYLGRINKKKGIDLIFESFFKLASSSTKNIKLIISGPIDNYEVEFKQLQNKFQHKNILILPSTISAEKEYLFTHVDSFLLPSFSEGFSIAALEAIAYGKACIFSKNIGFSDEVLKSNSALISNLSVESLLENMMLLTNNQELNQLFQINSRNLFLNNFQIENIAKRYYHEILLGNEQ